MSSTNTQGGFEALRGAVLGSHERQLRYALALVEDLTPSEMVAQPVDGVVMNHPAWVLSHLNAYMPVLTVMLEGGTPDDPIDHEFGRKSAPVSDESRYLRKDGLVEAYAAMHAEVGKAFARAPAELLCNVTPIPRFTDRFPTIVDVSIQLLIKHEATHLGQLSAWRRAGGRPMVAP